MAYLIVFTVEKANYVLADRYGDPLFITTEAFLKDVVLHMGTVIQVGTLPDEIEENVDSYLIANPRIIIFDGSESSLTLYVSSATKGAIIAGTVVPVNRVLDERILENKFPMTIDEFALKELASI